MRRFVNEPHLELRRAPEREWLTESLGELDAQLPLRAPVWIGADRAAAGALVSTDPGAPDRVVAHAGQAGAAEVDAALELARSSGAEWSDRSVGERAAVLEDAATLLARRRRALAALEVRECAKPWREADADVCEAIDYLRFYASAALALDDGRPVDEVPGERNRMRFRPRGITAVIAPWNFPIAIPAGMTVAALATGNPVVLKPAEQSPGCAHALVMALRDAGVPGAALGFLPGNGDTGRLLVAHPDVHTIAFTGSAAVGQEILVAAAAPGRKHLKHVLAEMGGKNCVIVDADADLDEVVPGIVASAFGYAGQKCSAAARVLVHEQVADALAERLSGAVETLVVGQAEDFATDVPPLIERDARDRVDRYATVAAEQGEILARAADGLPETGWFCPPLLASRLPEDSPILSEEIFGPLLTIESVASVDEACDRVDALPYALTGGLYSRNPAVVARVVARSPVGNLYVNRPITGAMVGRQPFGGNRLSGTGAKAGSADYLLEFVEPIVVSENTTRHGLAV